MTAYELKPLRSAANIPAMKSKKNQAAIALGKLAKGVPKTFTPEELERRAQRLVEARKKLAAVRAAKKKTKA